MSNFKHGERGEKERKNIEMYRNFRPLISHARYTGKGGDASHLYNPANSILKAIFCLESEQALHGRKRD